MRLLEAGTSSHISAEDDDRTCPGSRQHMIRIAHKTSSSFKKKGKGMVPDTAPLTGAQ